MRRICAGALVAAAGIAAQSAPERETEVQDAIATRLAHHLAADGSYRLKDEFRFLIARA
jgi:hypothetical protein